MTPQTQATTQLAQRIIQWKTLARTVGIITGALSLVLWIYRPQIFYPAYLTGFIYWIHFSLGALAILMLSHVTGGSWGVVIRRILEAMCLAFPILAVAFIPILVGMQTYFPWAIAANVANDAALQHKALYLNIPFFIGRAIFYFGVWALLAHRLRTLSLEEDRLNRDEDLENHSRKLQRLSAPGLIVFGLTVTFASVDWIMSLEPHWFSTAFGLLFMGGCGAGVFALSILLLGRMLKHRPFLMNIKADHLHDLGKFLLAFVMLWAYLAFSQFLIIWSGNLPEETPWYLHRQSHGWQWIALLLIGFHFLTPLMVLLSRKVKRQRQPLMFVASGLLIMRYLDLYWHIMPNFKTHGLYHVLSVIPLVAIGSWWAWKVMSQLQQAPLLPKNMKSAS